MCHCHLLSGGGASGRQSVLVKVEMVSEVERKNEDTSSNIH